MSAAFAGASEESQLVPGENFFSGGKNSDSFSDGLGPLERWHRALERESETVDVIVQRCAEGERVKEICRTRGWPYSVVAMWLSENEVVAKRVEAARRIWAEDMAVETVGIADAAGDNVPADKLRVDTRFRLAGKLDRDRWGESVEHRVVVDPFAEMLRRVSERNLKQLRDSSAQGVIEGVVVVDALAPVAIEPVAPAKTPAPISTDELL